MNKNKKFPTSRKKKKRKSYFGLPAGISHYESEATLM